MNNVENARNMRILKDFRVWIKVWKVWITGVVN